MTQTNEISPEEKECIEELKKRTIHDLTPKMLEDPTIFYRFSKARNFNLAQAESMLRKAIAWRKEYKADTIIEDYEIPEVIKKYSPSTIIGFDKEGHPVRFISMSNADVPGILKSAKKIDLLKYNMKIIESDIELCNHQSKKLEKPVTTITYIYDYHKLPFSTATNKEAINMIMVAISMFQDNYPERIKSIYVINASLYFSILFSMVKVIVAAAVLDKIRFYGLDGWKEVLTDIIDVDVLPAFLGGNRTDPDGNPLCKETVVHGGKIPESYYLQKSCRTLNLEPGVKKLKVTRFSSTNLPFEIDEPGSLLEWVFETKSKDIGFGLFFKDKSLKKSEQSIELVPKQRIDTWSEPETGMYKCEKAGTYILVFDNSYSWIYAKEIYYKAKVIPPNGELLECDTSIELT